MVAFQTCKKWGKHASLFRDCENLLYPATAVYRLRLFGHAFAAQAASFISWS
jgi:hypothetical protein